MLHQQNVRESHGLLSHPFADIRQEHQERDHKVTYDKVDGSVVFNLHKSINSLNQNGSTLVEYYNNLNSLWKQYDAMINESYLIIRSNILPGEPLPLVMAAFLVVSGEESHRNATSVEATKPTVTAFAARNFDNKRTFNINNNFSRGLSLNNNASADVHSINATTDTRTNNSPIFLSNEHLSRLMSLLNDNDVSSANVNMAVNNITLYDVLVVPEYTVSFLTIHKIAKESKLFIGFDETKCYIQDLKANRIVAIGNQCNGFYLFDVDNACKSVCNNCIVSCNVSKYVWHQRLGHPADQVLDVLKHALNLDSYYDDDNSGATSIEENNTHHERNVSVETDLIGNFYENAEFHTKSTDLLVNTVRRSSRPTKLPTILNDKVKYGVERVVNYANFNSKNLCFASSLNKCVEPTCYNDAIR
ncbi:hypothetical protein Tco_0763644 [Tanacetum coccineum]